MAFKRFIAVVAAVALTVSPTIAAAGTARAASAQAQEIAPAAERVEGSELRRSGIIIPLIGIIAIILAILLITKKGGDKEPISP